MLKLSTYNTSDTVDPLAMLINYHTMTWLNVYIQLLAAWLGG